MAQVMLASLLVLSSVTTSLDDEDAALVAIAAEAGVAAQDLQGAINTTGLAPREYLRMTGELPSPPVASSRPDGRAGASASTVWDRLVLCEAGGRWNANTGNGFSGGLQFLPSTWRGHGGNQFAPAAHLATREQQITVAERVLKTQGWRAWPACSRRLGLR